DAAGVERGRGNVPTVGHEELEAIDHVRRGTTATDERALKVVDQRVLGVVELRLHPVDDALSTTVLLLVNPISDDAGDEVTPLVLRDGEELEVVKGNGAAALYPLDDRVGCVFEVRLDEAPPRLGAQLALVP